MGKSLDEIAQELKNCEQKVQLIYAFNGTGKTRLSRKFKDLIAVSNPENIAETENEILTRKKILYYNAFTEDLFYWDNDLAADSNPKLRIQPNSFTEWILKDQGQDRNIITTFQRYTNDKLNPKFNEEYEIEGTDGNTVIIPAFSEVTFSLEHGDDESSENLKISRGEESNFIWCIFYTLLEQVIDVLNVAEPENRETNDFDELEYIFIDDPVSSLDENHLIELAVDIAQLVKSCESNIKFIITTHNPLFYNVLHNEFSRGRKFLLEKLEDGTYDLKLQRSDSPFSYHLHLKNEITRAISEGTVQKYHFNLLRNLLEKTSNFLGYERWGDLIPRDPDGSNPTEKRITRMINLYNHSTHSGEEAAIIKNEEKQILNNLIQMLDNSYGFKTSQNNVNEET